MNNLNISVRNNQVFLSQCLNIVNWLDSRQCESNSSQNISTYFTKKRESLLRFIIVQVINFKRAFPSHLSMQQATGLSRSAVIRALKIFEEMKIIDIDHRNLMHMSNIYSLGPVLRNATVVRYLSNKFKELVPAFCRTMERLGNLMFSKKPKELYTIHFKQNATPTTEVVVFVPTNTNTTTSYYKEREKYGIMKKPVKDNFRKIGDSGGFSYESKVNPKYATQEGREKSHNEWTNHRYKDSGYSVKDTPVYLEEDISKICHDSNFMDKTRRIEILKTKALLNFEVSIRNAQHEPDLDKRLLMLKAIYAHCPGASKPYVNILIKKVITKINA